MKNKALSICIALITAVLSLMGATVGIWASAGIGNGSAWCSALFDNPSTDYDKSLAMVSAEMSEKIENSYSSVKGLYNSYGIEDVYGDAESNTYVYIIGKSKLNIDGRDTTVLVITARGTGKDLNEIAGDILKGDETDFLGKKVWGNALDFEETIWNALKAYVVIHPELKNEYNLKILVNGHSLGGAAANMVGARLTKGIGGNQWWSDKVSKKDIYVYTFGAIKVLSEKENERLSNVVEEYENIHNIYNYYDSYGPNGNQAHRNVSSVYAKFGHTDLFNGIAQKETGSAFWKNKDHDMATYKEAIQNPITSKLDVGSHSTVPEINIGSIKKELRVGEQVALDVLVNRNSLRGVGIQWSSSKPDIVSVSGKGIIKGLKIGKSEITAKIKGTIYKASCKIAVKMKETNTIKEGDCGKKGGNVKWKVKKNGSYHTLIISGTGKMKDYSGWGCNSNERAPWLRYGWMDKINKVIIENGVTRIGNWAFTADSRYSKNNIKSINIANSVTSIGKGSLSTLSCKNIKIPNSVRTIESNAFEYSLISSITMSNKIAFIGDYAFSGCIKLTKITIPGSVKSIGDDIFFNCSNLKDIYHKGTKTKWKKCGRYTSENTSSKGFTIRSSVYATGASTYHTAKMHYNYSKNAVKVEKLKIADATKNLTVGKSVKLKAVVYPSNVTNKKINWKSSNTKYATVSSKGKVTAKEAGKGKTVKITALSTDGSKKKAVVGIKIKPSKVKTKTNNYLMMFNECDGYFYNDSSRKLNPVNMRYSGSYVYKVGSYYIKISCKTIDQGYPHNTTVSISKNRTHGYKRTPLSGMEFFTNGKDAYYVKARRYSDSDHKEKVLYLCRYIFSTGKEIRVQKLSTNWKNHSGYFGYHFWSISAIHNGNIYLSDESMPYSPITYTYNIKKGKLLKTKMEKCCLTRIQKGNYVIGLEATPTSRYQHPERSLYKFTKSGLKKIRNLSKRSLRSEFIGGYIYWSEYGLKDGYTDNTAIRIYRCKLGGTNKKLIASYKAPNGKYIFVTKIYSNRCILGGLSSSKHEYIYNSKKIRKISTV